MDETNAASLNYRTLILPPEPYSLRFQILKFNAYFSKYLQKNHQQILMAVCTTSPGIWHYLSIRAAHKSLERSFSLAVLLIFLPSGGFGSSTSIPIFRAWQNPQIQSPSGIFLSGGSKHTRWNPPKQSSHSIITLLPVRKQIRHSSTSGSSSADSGASFLFTYTSSPTSNSPPSYTTFL
ncbi:hypothetical protein C4D60_Mb08t31220 [Musa balbisiana]|uniref:Uncharacterized protein n=1 Tax=Musa balbisiana TaxID=52838 RepID=A0A4S8K7W8_MUSBA|nr:hypothetical protein C4D60_Mb08t31220 [Musa balbisiana]